MSTQPARKQMLSACWRVWSAELAGSARYRKIHWVAWQLALCGKQVSIWMVCCGGKTDAWLRIMWNLEHHHAAFKSPMIAPILASHNFGRMTSTGTSCWTHV